MRARNISGKYSNIIINVTAYHPTYFVAKRKQTLPKIYILVMTQFHLINL